MRHSTLDQQTIADINLNAQQVWDKATDNQKVGVRFGMNDVALLKAGGYDPYERDKAKQDMQHQFILALMDCAKRDGGMRV